MRRHWNVYTLAHSISNAASGPSIARRRGRMRSGCFSTSGSASQPSWKSTRQTSSACRCSSTDCPRMERRVEPEPAFGRKVGLHVDVRDQETIAEHLPLRLEAKHPAYRTARTVARDDPVRGDRVTTLRRVDVEIDMRLPASNAADAVLPAQVDRRKLAGALDEELLEPVLLQVDERGPAVPCFGKQVELVRERVPKEHLADVPADALCRRCADLRRGGRGCRASASHSRSHASRRTRCRRRRARRRSRHVAPDRSRLPGRPAPRRRQRPDGAGAHHPARRSAGKRSGAASTSSPRALPAFAQPSSVFHISLSRSAVQMRGSRCCVASS